MFEEGIRPSNKYMTNHDKNKESSYLEYVHANNLYGCVCMYTF